MRLFIGLLLACLMYGCGDSKSSGAVSPGNNGSEKFNYRAVTDEDLSGVVSAWNARDLSARNVTVLRRYEEGNITVTLVAHGIQGKIHYAAILSPNPMPDAPVPVIIQASGLDQSHPEIYVQYYVDLAQGKPALASYIQVIPAFRGDSLLYRDYYLEAQGDRCDAWDGPTDDAIASLNVAQNVVPEGNYTSIIAAGASRGGTVALLLAMRDSRINTVLATAAPVDFYQQEVKDLYKIQYPCFFILDKTEAQSRFSMLASSPIYFSPMNGAKNIFIFHGQNDQNVPVWNAQDMTTHLDLLGTPITTHIYPADHFSIGGLPAYNEDYDAVIQKFLLDSLNQSN